VYGQLSSKQTFGEFFANFCRATTRHEAQYKQKSRQEEIRNGNSQREFASSVAKPWSNVYTLSVSFAKEPYKRTYILQKRPIILSSLLIVATPCLHGGEDP